MSNFSRNRSTKDGLSFNCKGCAHGYYLENADCTRERIRIANQRLRDEKKEKVFLYLLDHPCVDCGESDPIVLDFDHVRGTKTANVARLVSTGVKWATVVAEIAKCEVRCANCHRRVTHLRRQEVGV